MMRAMSNFLPMPSALVRTHVDAVTVGQCFNKNRKFNLTAVPLQNNSPALLLELAQLAAMIECFDSPGDLNFMEEPLIFVWTICRIGC